MSDTEPTRPTMIPSDDLVLVASMALAALDLDHIECASRQLARLDAGQLRRLGEILDTASSMAFSLAGPHPDLDGQNSRTYRTGAGDLVEMTPLPAALPSPWLDGKRQDALFFEVFDLADLDPLFDPDDEDDLDDEEDRR